MKAADGHSSELKQDNSPIIGIDLGTTNSEVAIFHEGKVKVLLVDHSRLMPSVLSLSASNELLIGKVAENNEMAFPENTVRCIKRKMGSQEEIRLGSYVLNPTMISSLFLKKLKAVAEEFLKQTVSRAVITVPALFNEQQRESTKEAALLAGLEPVRLLNEPTAAALVYAAGKEKKGRCLVYDLGGGTFDVSIVDFAEHVMEVRASHGDTHLGGVDFDAMIAQEVRQEFLKEHEIDLQENVRAWTRLMQAAERAKIKLSKEPSAEINEEFIAEKKGIALHVRYTLHRRAFEEMIRPTIERSMESVRSALAQTHLTASDLDRVILVGGSTYIPLVATLLEKELQIAPQATLNPSLVVAMGAAIEAANLEGQRVGPMMVDITPHSLGIDCIDAHSFELVNYVLIRRNTPLPCTASHIFYKMNETQKEIEITVYQGEQTIPGLNHPLGTFKLDELKGSSREIYVKFELDRSGLLRATVLEVASGKQVSRVLHKQAKMRVQSASLSDLETIRIATKPTPVNEPIENAEEVDVTGGLIQEESTTLLDKPLVALTEKLLERARTLLHEKALEKADQEELTQALSQATQGDLEAYKRLETLVYYLE